MDNEELLQVKERMKVFHDRHISQGGKMTQYTCNHCEKKIPTIQPDEKLVSAKGYWDSVTTCPECGELNFVCVWTDGKTKSHKFPFEG